MKMQSSTISDLRAFVQRRDFLPSVNDDVVRLQFYRYGISDLTSLSQFWSFLMVAARRIVLAIFYPGCYVLNNGDLYTRLSNSVNQAVRSLFRGILVLVLLPILFNYFNGCARARSFSIAAQI
jgi:hypothetical protein